MSPTAKTNGSKTTKVNGAKRVKAAAVHYSKEASDKAMQFGKEMISSRNTTRTSTENNTNFKWFADWCRDSEEFCDPREVRAPNSPEAVICYISMKMAPQVDDISPSINVAKKAASGISDYYTNNPDCTGTTQWFVKDGVGYGNPMRSPMVVNFMKGLRKTKLKTHITRRAAPMSKIMLKMLLSFVEVCPHYSRGLKLYFKSLASLAWYGCARISEILGLTYDLVQLNCSRPSLDDPMTSTIFHKYTLKDRKTESGDNRTYHLHYFDKPDVDICAKHHLDDWLKYASDTLGHTYSDDLIFPAYPISRKYNHLDAQNFHWNTPMREGAITTLINQVIEHMLLDSAFLKSQPDGHDKLFKNIYITTHTFRRGFAQWVFFHEYPDKRWSLKCLKWWGGWSETDSVDVVMKYLLDTLYDVEDEILADSLAPDRRRIKRGCPTTWLNNTHEQLHELVTPLRDRDQEFAMRNVYKKELDQMAQRHASQLLEFERRLFNYINEKLPTRTANDQSSSSGFSISNALGLQHQAGLEISLEQQLPLGTGEVSLVPSKFPKCSSWIEYLYYYFNADKTKNFFRPVIHFVAADHAANVSSRISKSTGIASGFLALANFIDYHDIDEIMSNFVELQPVYVRLVHYTSLTNVKVAADLAKRSTHTITIDNAVILSKEIAQRINDKEIAILQWIAQNLDIDASL